MGKKPEYKMDQKERAKQFMPFTLENLFPTLEKALPPEENWIGENEEDKCREIDQLLTRLKPGDQVWIRYGLAGYYKEWEGTFRYVDPQEKVICIGQKRIDLEEVTDLVKEEEPNETS